MSRFLAQPEDGEIIRGDGEVKVLKAEETKESADLETEAQDDSR